MPGEIITIQAGQCGNQVGSSFWNQVRQEHGISREGIASPVDYREDHPDIFFQRNAKDRYTPRAILVDYEPRVLTNINSNFPNFFNPNSMHYGTEGGGSSNNWASGHALGTKDRDLILDLFRKEMDACDNPEGFQLIHSVAGGTGSGFGSFVLELLNDNFSKKLVQTYSVFPQMGGGSSDVVVQPYNSILAMKRLIECADATIVFDNSSLMSISSQSINIKDSKFADENKLLAAVISATTNPLRFPSYSYNSLSSIFSTLVPNPDLHFLIPSYTPFPSDSISNQRKIRRSTAYDVILQLIDKTVKLAVRENNNNDDLRNQTNDLNYNIAMLDILIGDIHQSDVQRALIKARDRVKFVKWTSSAIHLAYGQKSPYLDTDEANQHVVSGLALSNSTSIVTLFNETARTFDAMKKRNAFLSKFTDTDYPDIELELQDSREVVQNVIDEYSNAARDDYLDDEEEYPEEGDYNMSG